jgi:fimbrial chaperone protein
LPVPPCAPSPRRWSRSTRCGSPTASNLVRLLIALLLGALAAPAFAADLQISPIRITLDPQNPNAVMTLINRGDGDTLLQLSVMSWSQDASGEVLVPTREVLANPGVFLLKAGEQQVARFALRVAPDVKERSYRIVVQEVPRQRVENGLATVLRLMVPVFVPTPNPNVAVEWSARQGPQGLEVQAHNIGNVHVQVKVVKLGSGSTPVASKTVNLYVLPGATGTIRMPPGKPVAAGTMLQLSAESDQISFSTSVRVGASEGVSGHP